jgi:hypothetical protein
MNFTAEVLHHNPDSQRAATAALPDYVPDRSLDIGRFNNNWFSAKIIEFYHKIFCIIFAFMARASSIRTMAKYRIISLRKLSEASKIDYYKLYRNLCGDTINSLTPNDKATLANVAQAEMREFFKFLGLRIKFERL